MTPWIIAVYSLIAYIQPISCSEPHRNVRLVGGFNKYEGRVEVFWNNTWGTICDDQWDRRDAWVICKELGFGSPLQIASTAHFGPGPGPILLDNLDCKGTESNILNCSHSGIGVHDCSHFEDAGVACSPPVLCLTDPCDKGTCVDSGESFHCICTPGFMGKLCDQEVNCTLPDNLPPGAHFVSPHSSYSYNEVVIVSCTDGPGSTSWTCNQYGQWDSHYIPCASLTGAYRSANTHSYTVIGIGSALVVIGVAVFIFAIYILIRYKRQHRVESLYEISNLSRLETVPSAYLTMTGGPSPMPSPRRSSSVLSTDHLIKASRANMALPPTPTEIVRSPLSITTSLPFPTTNGNQEPESRNERQTDKEVDNQAAKQSEKQTVNTNEKPSTGMCNKPVTKPAVTRSSSNSSATKQPVAPARPKKQNNEQRSKPLFKFPPPPIPTTPAPSKTSRADGTASSANGGVMHNDKSKLLSNMSKQRSLEDEGSSLVVGVSDGRKNVKAVKSHELGKVNNVKDDLNKPVKSPYSNM
nr:uncharacterized protein LOC129271604 [Lytechinus pictus]